MSGKQIVNISEGICFRLRNVVSSQRQSEQTGLKSLWTAFEDGLHSTMLKLARYCSRLHHLWTDDDKTLVLIF